MLKDLHDPKYKGRKQKNPSFEELYKEYSSWEKGLNKKSQSKIISEKIGEEHTPVTPLYYGTGRNEKYPCGSGLKYKKCHGKGY